MLSIRLTALFAFAAVWGLALGVSAQSIPIEAFKKYPALSSVSLSPDGKTIAAIVHRPGSDGLKTAVATWDVSGRLDPNKFLSPRAITPGNDRMQFTSVRALQSGKVLVVGQQPFTGPTAGCLEGRTTGVEKTFLRKLFLANQTLDDIAPAFERAQIRTDNDLIKQCESIRASRTFLINDLVREPDWVLIERLERQGRRLYRFNLKDGHEEFFARSEVENGWVTMLRHPQTHLPVVQFSRRSGDNDQVFQLRFRQPETEDWVEPEIAQFRLSSRHILFPRAFDPHSGMYYVATDLFSDKTAIYPFDARTGTFGSDPALAHPDYNIANVVVSLVQGDGNSVIGGVVEGADQFVIYTNPEFQAVQLALEQRFPRQAVRILNQNSDLSRILISVQGPSFPPQTFLLADQRHLFKLGSSFPEYESHDLAPTKLVHYKARDGLNIPAFLTLPPGHLEESSPIPMIIYPHGGPWVRDYARFDPMLQLLVSHGYGVLQPQYRGSAEWGRAHWLAGDREWGQKMQDDKDDGARWLVEQGYADRDRLAIFGFSYGGYAAMAASVRPAPPYQCAIAAAGVSNLTKLGNRWNSNAFQRLFQGQTVAGLNPLKHASEATIPALIIHGDRDVRVPLYHSRDFYRAIHKAQPQSQLKVIKDMPHGLPWPEHREIYIQSILDFLDSEACFGHSKNENQVSSVGSHSPRNITNESQ